MTSAGDEEGPADPWASNGPHSTVRLPAGQQDGATKTVPAADGWRRTRRAFKVLVIAGLTTIIVIVVGIALVLPHLSNPFKAKTTDRSGPVLVLSIRDLARFEAASGNFQVIVDVQNDRSYIPDIIFSERSLFIAAGSVDAYVDFSQIAAGDVVASADGKTATITLPMPQLEPPTIDPANSYVYSDQKGLVNKLQDLFSSDANKQQELYKLADQKISAAALSSQLVETAETNTRSMLIGFLKALGFTTITVNFPAA
jgi:hypothetical protein